MNTPLLDQVYEQVKFDRELVFKFFTIFSLFEYALKKTHFRQGNERSVEADWESFAKEIHDDFDPSTSAELQHAVDYLLTQPTKKQVLDGDDLLFVNSGVVNHRTIWLSTLIIRTRNNLFHGGKFRYDHSRDNRLIESCLVILEAWAYIHPDVEYVLENAR